MDMIIYAEHFQMLLEVWNDQMGEYVADTWKHTADLVRALLKDNCPQRYQASIVLDALHAKYTSVPCFEDFSEETKRAFMELRCTSEDVMDHRVEGDNLVHQDQKFLKLHGDIDQVEIWFSKAEQRGTNIRGWLATVRPTTPDFFSSRT